MSAAVLHPSPDMSSFRLNMISTLLSSPSTKEYERVKLLSEKIHLLINTTPAPIPIKSTSGPSSAARSPRSPATPGAAPNRSGAPGSIATAPSPADGSGTTSAPPTRALVQGLPPGVTPETVLDVLKTRLELARVLVSETYGSKYVEGEAELMQVDGMCRAILKRGAGGVGGGGGGERGAGWEAQWIAEVGKVRLEGLRARAELEDLMGRPGRAVRTREQIKALEQDQ